MHSKAAPQFYVNSFKPASFSFEHLGTTPVTMAAAKVFSTYELLEAILSQLTAVDIPMVMRTCSAWYSVITRSRTVQEARVLPPLKVLPSKIESLASGPSPV